MFLESFHSMSGQGYWTEIRNLGRVDIMSRVTVKVDCAEAVAIEGAPLDKAYADLAAAYIRKFTSIKDPAYLPDVMAAALEKGVKVSDLAEVGKMWDQISAKRIPFLTLADRPVGMRLEAMERPIFFEYKAKDRILDLGQRSISMLDCLDVFFNERLLHTFEVGRKEEIRGFVRQLPENIQDLLRYVSIAATVYASLITHHVITSLNEPYVCGEDCPERRILEYFRSPETPCSKP